MKCPHINALKCSGLIATRPRAGLQTSDDVDCEDTELSRSFHNLGGDIFGFKSIKN